MELYGVIALMFGWVGSLYLLNRLWKRALIDQMERQKVVEQHLFTRWVNSEVARKQGAAPTEQALLDFARARSLWVGPVEGMARALAEVGFVVLTPDAWKQVCENWNRPGAIPQGMSVEEWLERDD